MLIGLTGLAGSGKSEVANALIADFGFTRVKFAGPAQEHAPHHARGRRILRG
jgi:dephospho-CoA kinase